MKQRKKPIEANSFISFEFYGLDIYVHTALTERITLEWIFYGLTTTID